MVDAQDRGLGQLDPQDPVQVLCRLNVGPERFLDRHRVRGAEVSSGQRQQGRLEQPWRQGEVDQGTGVVGAHDCADVLRPGDVGRLEGEHLLDGVACGRCHAAVPVQLLPNVLPKIGGGPVSLGGAEDAEVRWDGAGLDQLGDGRHQQAVGEIARRAEDDHALDHGMAPFRDGWVRTFS